MHTKW
jgi:hypothetical protein